MYCFSLIKSGQVQSGNKKIIPASEFSELLSTKELLDKAEEEVDELKNKAKEAAKKQKAKAKQEGFEEGLSQFNDHILLLEDKLKALRHEMQRSLLPLALKATKKIVGETLKLHPETIVDIVMQAIKSVSQCKVVKLFVNKEDLELLEKEKSEVAKLFEQLESFTIEEHPEVQPGGCIIETERGILNATLENQYRALETAFEQHMRH